MVEIGESVRCGSHIIGSTEQFFLRQVEIWGKWLWRRPLGLMQMQMQMK